MDSTGNDDIHLISLVIGGLIYFIGYALLMEYALQVFDWHPATRSIRLFAITIFVGLAVYGTYQSDNANMMFITLVDNVIPFRDQYRDSHQEISKEVTVANEENKPANGKIPSDSFDKLERLDDLNESGVISDEEFEEKKAEILDQI